MGKFILTNGSTKHLSVEVVEDSAGLNSISPEWEQIWANDPSADIFSSISWFNTWWDNFGTSEDPIFMRVTSGYKSMQIKVRNIRLHILVVRDGSECIAIIPLILGQGNWCLCPARILLSPLNSQSWRSGLIVVRDIESVFDTVARHLRTDPVWDVLLLDGVPKESLAIDYFCRATVNQGLLVSERDFPWRQSHLVINGTWNDYLETKSKHFRKHLRQSEGYLARLGELSFECYDTTDREEKGLQIFFEIDQSSWKAVRGESVAAIPILRKFYINLFRKLHEHGRCEIWVLRIAGEPVSAVFCLKSKGILYTYKTSYREEYTSAKLSPGVSLLTYLIKHSYQSGLTEVDFLGDLPIIHRWTSSVREFDRACVFGTHWYGRLLHAVDFLARRLRSLRRKVKSWASNWIPLAKASSTSFTSDQTHDQ